MGNAGQKGANFADRCCQETPPIGAFGPQFWVLAGALALAAGCSSEVRPAELEFEPGGFDGAADPGTPNQADGCADVVVPADQPRRLNSNELDTIAQDVLGAAPGAYASVGEDYGVRVGSGLGISEAFLDDYLNAS
ncbi:MAG: hypothetical protein AAFQ82_17015, partial [Myxococcota bacterium]